MTLEDLQKLFAAGGAPELEIHGLDPMLYVVYVVVAGKPVVLVDAKGATLRFRGRYAAQRALADCGAQRATFVHRSAYGEMVGLDDGGADTELRETLLLTRD
jgi:hypothetical protein